MPDDKEEPTRPSPDPESDHNHEDSTKPSPDLPPDNLQKLQIIPPGDPGFNVEFRVGPFPPPHDTEEYERLLPGFTDRQMKLIEQAQEAGINERKLIINTDRLKTNWSGIISLLAIVAGVLLAALESPWAGVVLGLGGPTLKFLTFIFRLICKRSINGQDQNEMIS